MMNLTAMTRYSKCPYRVRNAIQSWLKASRWSSFPGVFASSMRSFQRFLLKIASLMLKFKGIAFVPYSILSWGYSLLQIAASFMTVIKVFRFNSHLTTGDSSKSLFCPYSWIEACFLSLCRSSIRCPWQRPAPSKMPDQSGQEFGIPTQGDTLELIIRISFICGRANGFIPSRVPHFSCGEE